MGYVNAMIVVGRLGTDPDLRTEDGVQVARFPVGTSLLYRRGGDTIRETEWHTVAVYGDKANEVARFLKKGGEVYVKGDKRIASYSTVTNVPRAKYELVARDIRWPGMGKPGLLNANQLPSEIIIGDVPDDQDPANVEVTTGIRIENLGPGLITPAGGVARSNAPGVSRGGAGDSRFKGGAGTAGMGGVQLTHEDDEDEFAAGFVAQEVNELAELEDLSARIGTGQDTFFGRQPAAGA